MWCGGVLYSLIRTNTWQKSMELENIILDAFGGVSVFIGHKIRKKLALVPVAIKKY